MPEDAEQRHARASTCLLQAKEAMEMAESCQSPELREELLMLATSWLKLAHEIERYFT